MKKNDSNPNEMKKGREILLVLTMRTCEVG